MMTVFNSQNCRWRPFKTVKFQIHDGGSPLKLLRLSKCDRVQDSHEEQEFWMTRLDWVGTWLNQFEMFGKHENCLSRWKQCCSRWNECWMKTMYK